MLVHASGSIYPGFSLFTFGGSCHYVVQTQNGCVIFDPGLSVHTEYIWKRLEADSNYSPEQIEAVFITHLHPERIAAIPYLKQKAPNLKVYGTELMQTKLQDETFVRNIYDEDLKLSALYENAQRPAVLNFETFFTGLQIDEILPKDNLKLSDELYIKITPAPGHTEESTAYIVEPYDFLIIDEGIGYFRGKEMTAPGGDWNLLENISTLQRLKDIDFAAICFPNEGIITGQLVRSHMQDIIQNCSDLISESNKKALPEDEARDYIKKSFFVTASRDPLLHYTLERTYQAILPQLA